MNFIKVRQSNSSSGQLSANYNYKWKLLYTIAVCMYIIH